LILSIIFIQNFFLWLEQKIVLNDLKFRKLDLLYFLVFMPTFLISSNLHNQIIGNIEIILLNGIFLYLLTRNVKTSIVVISVLYMIAISVDHIDYVIRPEHDIFAYAIIYLLIQIIVCGVLYLLMRLINNGKEINKFEYSNVEVIFSAGSLLAYLYLMIFVEIKQDNQIVMFLYNTVIILLMAVVLLIMHFSRVQTLKDKYEIQAKENRIKSNNQYIHEIERHYNELRTFRHNYQNVLLSLDEYLKTDDVKGLKSYYDDSIKPISVELNQKHYKLEDLSKINNKEVKSILFNKLYSAQLLNIDVSFEAKSEISQFYTDSLDLTLALGIILDNAIDETKEQKHGQIQVGVTYDDDEINIIVQNTLRANDVPIWKMKKLGFSTKGTERGVGLNNLDEIMNRNGNLMLETRKLDNYFLQKISIETFQK
jgi:Signal transduction histidine kinase regulating citrate/malate metabolism